MTFLSTLKFLTETGPADIEVHSVHLLQEKRQPIDASASGAKRLPETDIEVYFTPGKLPQEIAKEHMDMASSSLGIVMCDWSLPSMAQKAIETNQRLKGNVRVILDNERGRAEGAMTERLVDGDVKVILDQDSSLVHNKYMLIDDKAVLVMSSNWRTPATGSHRENFLLIRKPNIVGEYRKNFEEIWRNNQILKR